MNWQTLGWTLSIAALLICLGLLLGTTWTALAVQPRFRQLAEERRKLNAEWAAVRSIRRRRIRCPRCAIPLDDDEWYFEQLALEDRLDDD